MKKPIVSSRQILQKTGLRAAKTLTRWHLLGLIPKPTVMTHPSGRGKMSYWPEWVLGRCLRIRQLVDQGRTLDEIKLLLDNNWDQEENRFKRRYRFSDASKSLEFSASLDNLEDLIWRDKIAPLSSAFKDMQALSARLHRVIRQQTNRILEMVVDGQNPMIVIRGEEVLLLPDFMVSQLLAKTIEKQNSCLIVPIFAEVRSAFGDVCPEMPSAPSVCPAPKVHLIIGKRTREVDVRVAGPTDYEIARK